MAATLQYTPDGYPYYSDDNNTSSEELALPAVSPFDLNAARVRARAPTREADPVTKAATEMSVGEFLSGMMGKENEERYQLWPEKMVRSAVSAPSDALAGRLPFSVGLRPNDFSDNPDTQAPVVPMIERAQDMAGLAAGGPIASVRPKGAINSGMNRKMKNEYDVFHGSESNITNFDDSFQGKMLVGEKGLGHWFSSNKDAAEWYGPNVVSAKVKLENPLIVTDKMFIDNYPKGPTYWAKLAKEKGHDGVIIKNIQDGDTVGDVYSIFNKNNITLKSDTKAGTAISAVKNATPFYSVLEKSIANVPMKSGTKEQWVNALKKYGTTGEELDYVLGELPKGQISKGEIEKRIGENKVELKEVDKRVPTEEEYAALRKREQELVAKGNNATEAEKQEWADIQNKVNSVGQPKYSQWQLPGGEPGSYREKLLTLPVKNGDIFDPAKVNYKKLNDYGTESSYRLSYDDKEIGTFTDYKSEPRSHDEWVNVVKSRFSGDSNLSIKPLDTSSFHSSHWSEPNVLAHIRMNDRDIPGVGKSLHVEEIQSDWHQKGRKEGYKLSKEQKDRLEPEFNKIDDKLMASNDEAVLGHPEIREAVKLAVEKKIISKAEADTYLKYADSERVGAVPDAPFKDTQSWSGIAIKRMIREAAEKGYDAISWTPGEAQAARYDLSKHIEALKVVKRPSDGKYIVSTQPKVNHLVNTNEFTALEGGKGISADKLADHVGKELAEKIVNDLDRSNTGTKEYSGLDLKVGGEGMKAFYDKLLVDKVSNLGKKYGAKVEQKELSNGQKIWVLPITKELKEYALSNGFPLFSSPALIPVGGNPFTDKEKGFKLVPISGNPFEIAK